MAGFAGPARDLGQRRIHAIQMPLRQVVGFTSIFQDFADRSVGIDARVAWRHHERQGASAKRRIAT
jgi:hypothetical protein